MKKKLQLVLSLTLLLCVFGLNAQRNASYNTLTPVKQEVKQEKNAPEVRFVNEKGAVVILIDNQYHFPYDISDNKQHVAIQGFEMNTSYYYSEESGLVYIEGLAYAVSDDGIVAGTFTDPETGINVAGLWYPDVQEWQFLGMNPDVPNFGDSEYSGAWSMSNDGSKVAVMQFLENWNTVSYIWTPNGGYTELPSTSSSTRPNGINSNGNVVVGHAVNDDTGFWIPCYWVDGEYNEIPDAFGEALNVSEDGTYICGYMESMNGDAFLFNTNTSELLTISNTFEAGTSLSATCVTNEGNAFGYVANGFPPMPDLRRAFAYTGGELMSFNDYLLMNGVAEAENWTIYSINNVTPDGLTFVGAANMDGSDVTFILTLEESLCDGPKNLTYTIDENNHTNVILNWTAPEDPVDVTYEIYTSHTAEEPIHAGITETTFTVENLEAGTHSFVVKANWGGECLSSGSNIVRPTIYPCPESDMCELFFSMVDQYGDGWNGGYIKIVGQTSGMEYKVGIETGGAVDAPETYTLKLCPEVYEFTWVRGEWDFEVGFTITFNEEEVYNVEIEGITDTFDLTFLELDVDCGTSVGEMTAEDNIVILPNPAKDYFSINADNITKVEVVNALGQVVDVVTVNNSNKAQINTSNYKNGMYFVKVTTSDNNTAVKKVVISK